MIIRKHAELYDLMAESGIGHEVVDFIAYFSELVKNDDLKNDILSSTNQIYWSYNDTFLICHLGEEEEQQEAVIEISNPYAKDGFAFFKVDDFFEILATLQKCIKVSNVNKLIKEAVDRYDFEDSKEYW